MNTKEYENILIGHMIMSGDVPEGLSSDMFSDKIGRDLFNCILSCEHLDMSSVSHRMKTLGYKNAGSLISDICQSAVGVTSIKSIIPILREGRDRRLIEESVIKLNDMNLTMEPVGDIRAKLENTLLAIQPPGEHKTMKDILHKTLDAIENKVASPQSWCRELNHLTKGFNPTDLLVIAGRPSMGKTALALCDYYHLSIKERVPCLFMSLEMGDMQITSRLLSIATGIELEKILDNKLSTDNWKQITSSSSTISDSPMFLDDRGGLSIYDIGASVRRHHKENGIKVVFIDYLQLILTKTQSDNRNNEVAFITRYLKGLAKELNICVVVLSQLNREVEMRKSKRPMLSDLRDSGAIEQDADIVLFPFRPSWYEPVNDPDEIIVAKNRNGALGTAKVMYQAHLTRFTEMR